MSRSCQIRILVCLTLVLATSLAHAQQSNTARPPPDSEGERPAREQTIYIPYTKLRQIFEKEGRGVFVPYEEFQRLWKAAQSAIRKVEPDKPPIAALISQIDSQAGVSRDVMTITAKLQIELLAEGWHEVPLRLKDAAIRSAKLGDTPARLLYSPETGYRVLIEKKGNAPETIKLTLEYSKAFSKQPGTNSVEFDAPQAPVNRWQIRIPEPGVKVSVEPNIAASDAAAAQSDQSTVDASKETLVQALVGSASTVRIAWTAKAEGAAGLAALVTAQARQEMTIDEGVVHTRTMLTYDIQRADVTQLAVEVPADHNVVNVFDPNVQKWEKQPEGSIQTLTITLFQPTRGTQNVLIELEKFAGDREMPQEMTHAEIRAPVVRAVQAGTEGAMINIGRQQGVVVVRLGSSLRGEATSRTGLVQVDAADLPVPLGRQEWTFAYRYAAVPFDLMLTVEKLQPQIEVEELVEVYLEPGQITADLMAILNIQRAGVFQVELDVPEGYEIRNVQGRAAAGASAAVVDSHHLEDVEYTPDPAQPDVKAKRKTKLVVSLARRAMGKVGLWVELFKRQDDANLLAPTDTASDINVPLPRVQPASVMRTSGRLLVYAPESLRINPKEAQGLRPISPREAVQQIESTRGDRFSLLREIVAYAYTPEAASLLVEGQRRRPYVETRELLTAHIESGVVRYEATFFFDIKYSGVRQLRIDVPAALAAEVRNLTPAIREQRIEPQPADVAADYVAWRLVGEGELLGSATVKFAWEKKLGELPIGQPKDIELPQFKVIGADRFWGQIAASKAETIEISVKDQPQGLRPIDPQRDLMAGVNIVNTARAFEFHEDWSLGLTATRYQLEEVKRTSIERAFVRMVVTRGDKVAVQALYRLRSARQRVPLKIPGVDPKDTADTLDAQPLRVNNQAAPLEHDGTQFFIPLTGHSADEAVLVELRYTVDGNGSSLALPEFQDDPAVQQVFLAVWLPEEWRIVADRGPWTDESSTTWLDQPSRGAGPDDRTLLSQVRQGIEACDTAGDGFPVDGRRYLYSTLQPPSSAAGALRLTTLHRNVVNASVFLLVAIMGLALTPRSIGVRLWWLTGLIVAIVLIAVFAPALARAVLAPPLYLAIGLVLAIWLAQWLAWVVPGCTSYCTARFSRAVAATAVAAAATTAVPPQADPPLPDAPAAEQEGGPAHG